jgi:hypothetical protein
VNDYLELANETDGTLPDGGWGETKVCLSDRQFDQLTEKLLYTATAHGRIASDALAALAKALGTLSTFTARREGLSVEAVLRASQETVATFAMAAEIYMNENPEADPSKP